MLCGLLFYCLQNHFTVILILINNLIFCTPDDMAYQYLSKRVQNIVIPEISFLHDQSIKTKYSLPKDSQLVKEDVELRYGKFIGIHEEWYKKWGFRYDPRKVLSIFNNRIVKFLMLKILPSYYWLRYNCKKII